MRACFLILGICVGATACLSPAQIRPARTLEPGEHEVGIALSGANVRTSKVTWYTGTSTNGEMPANSKTAINGGPELGYHYGIVDNVEAGVRLGGGAALVEADATYRLLRTSLGGGVLHVATGTIVGMSLAEAVGGGRALLAVRATWDLNDHWGVTAALHTGYRWVDGGVLDPHAGADTLLADKRSDGMRWFMGKSGLLWGGGLSGDWHDDDWICRVFAEFDAWPGEIGVTTKPLAPYSVHVVQAGFSIGYKFGKDAAALRKAHDDLDALTKPKEAP